MTKNKKTRRILSTLLAFVLILMCAIPARAEMVEEKRYACGVIVMDNDGMRLRGHPSMSKNSREKALIYKGDEVKITKIAHTDQTDYGDWLYVQIWDTYSKQGWIPVDYVKIVDYYEESTYKFGTILKGDYQSVNVRAQPTTNSEKIGSIRHGQDITITSKVTKYPSPYENKTEIWYGTEGGYVRGDFVSTSGNFFKEGGFWDIIFDFLKR